MRPSKCAICGQAPDIHEPIPETLGRCPVPEMIQHMCKGAEFGLYLSPSQWEQQQSANSVHIQAAKAEAWDEGEEAGTTNMRHDSRLTNPYTEQESANHE